MTRLIIIIISAIQMSLPATAQSTETIEIHTSTKDTSSNAELQNIYNKFNDWVITISNGVTKFFNNQDNMVNNVIMFSEVGLLMKDLDLHPIESCKKLISLNLPKNKSKMLIYIAIESQLNKNELIEILTFLKDKIIDYYFGDEKDIIALFIK